MGSTVTPFWFQLLGIAPPYLEKNMNKSNVQHLYTTFTDVSTSQFRHTHVDCDSPYKVPIVTQFSSEIAFKDLKHLYME